MRTWARSFLFAGRGLALAWHERNFRVQCAAGWCALAMALLAGLPAARVALLLALVGAVLAAETMNTAVEVVVDLVVPGHHPLAGSAKDLAAGAVLAISLAAFGAGVILFRPLWLRPGATLAAVWAAHPASAVAAACGAVALIALAGGTRDGPRTTGQRW